MSTYPQLTNNAGRLATPRALMPKGYEDCFIELDGTPYDPVLIYFHSGGDPDTVSWPNPKAAHLRGALYDARETGFIPDVPIVLLPDGKEFVIDA